jgi:hypothetical protein
LLQHQAVDTAEVVRSNPKHYDAYRIAGDYCKENKWYPAAINYYTQALKYEIATTTERDAIFDKIKWCEKKMKP